MRRRIDHASVDTCAALFGIDLHSVSIVDRGIVFLAYPKSVDKLGQFDLENRPKWMPKCSKIMKKQTQMDTKSVLEALREHLEHRGAILLGDI